MNLDQTVIDRLRRPIRAVWDYIGGDAGAMCGDDNVGAVEMSIDAGRLVEIANDQEADELIHALCEKYGYDELLAHLSTNIDLV